MKHTFPVRPLKPSDVSVVILLDHFASALVEQEPLEEESFRSFMQAKCTMGYVALMGRDVLGFLLTELESDRQLRIHRLTVDPNWQRQGIGSSLLRSVEKNADKIVAETPDSTLFLDAHMLFKSLGYQGRLRRRKILFEKTIKGAPKAQPATVSA